MYSSEFYNGITGMQIYFVRFISCVALHAVWAGSIGISANQNPHWLQSGDEEDGILLPMLLGTLRIIWVPMLLHGLYDTLLKKDMSLLALVIALLSFAFLAWQIYTLRQDDDQTERASFVKQYLKQKTSPRMIS
jgi:RsiW-degrading membrane proteinase PrsW (M82 family)